jgi:glucose-6-phosphate isomerase
MSVIRPRPPEDPLAYEATGPAGRPWDPGPLAGLLEAVRRDLVANSETVDLPRRLLAEYDTRRPESRLFAVLAEARRIRDLVDRLVIVAGGGLGPGARLVAACCCHPFHDQLSRGDRGGRPRLTWVDAEAGNDRLQGLLDLVAAEGRPRGDDLLERWAILAADSPADDPVLLATVELLLPALGGHTAAAGLPDPRLAAERFVAVSASSGGRLAALAAAVGCRSRVAAGPELDSPQGIFTAAGLLPAAIAGCDVVQLLKGASAMLVRFAEAPPASNPVLADAAISLAARAAGWSGRACSGGGLPLGDLSAWLGSVRPAAAGAAALVTHVWAGEPRRDRLAVPPGAVGSLAARTWPEFVAAVSPVEPPPKAAVTIRLPRLDEHALGQLLQLLVLSAAVERRLERGV